MVVDDSLYCLLIRGTGLSVEEQKCVARAYEKYGRDVLYCQMEKRKILPFAANAFASCGLDKPFWEKILKQYRERNRAILRCLSQVYEELDRQGVKKMFVSENLGALLSSGNDIALFASGDVDNHADYAEKEKIYRAFDTLGYTRMERFSGNHQIAAEFFPPSTVGMPEKFYISVDFYPLARLKLPCFIHSDEFVDWNALYCYDGTAVKLPPVNALMYICMLHVSLHSFSRAPDIRLYIDLLNMSRLQVDYEKLAWWCSRDNTCTRVATATRLSNLLMHTNFPEILTALSKRCARVIYLVYDTTKNDLRYEPRGLKVMLIEVCCHDKGILAGIWAILFPDKVWMKKVYGNSGISAHCKHFLKVIH